MFLLWSLGFQGPDFGRSTNPSGLGVQDFQVFTLLWGPGSVGLGEFRFLAFRVKNFGFGCLGL